jgi:hypothetical protein
VEGIKTLTTENTEIIEKAEKMETQKRSRPAMEKIKMGVAQG